MATSQSILFSNDATDTVTMGGVDSSTETSILFGETTAKTAAWINASAPGDTQKLAAPNENWEKKGLLAG